MDPASAYHLHTVTYRFRNDDCPSINQQTNGNYIETSMNIFAICLAVGPQSSGCKNPPNLEKCLRLGAVEKQTPAYNASIVIVL